MAANRSCLATFSLRMQNHLRRWLHRYTLLLLLMAAGYAGARALGDREAQQLEFNHVHLPQTALPGAGPLRIALLSDIHNERQLFERCVEQVEKEQPDLIILGGDLVMVSERFMRTRKIITLLRRLKAVAPTYAILGNQDYEKLEQVQRVLSTAGIPLLRNASAIWQTPSGTSLQLTGLGDWNEGDEAPERCLPVRGQAHTPILLLSHDPESRHLLQNYDWQLMLSGHTHGGQLGNPFTGEYISLRSSMPAGVYQENGRYHVVSRGIGSILGMRFFCPPEMVTISVGESPR